MRVVNQKLRKAIEHEGLVARIEGLWWQFSLTERSLREPSAVILLRIWRARDGTLEPAAHGKRMAAFQPDTGAKRRRRRRNLRASSTIGKGNVLSTRTRRS
jgi:hypothetical protein